MFPCEDGVKVEKNLLRVLFIFLLDIRRIQFKLVYFFYSASELTSNTIFRK
jgi:hypothetical protein